MNLPQVGMMKLFQHANIQHCLAAFAADMEVLLSLVGQTPFRRKFLTRSDMKLSIRCGW